MPASETWFQQIADAAEAAGVDASIAIEQMLAESNGNPNARSSTGAIGLFQLEPATAAQLGVNPYDPSQNIQGGTTYLSQLLTQFNGDYSAALAAYNWGPSRVSNAMNQYGSNWLSYAPQSVQNYVNGILSNASQYSAQPTVDASTLDPSVYGDPSLDPGMYLDPNAAASSPYLIYALIAAGVLFIFVVLR